MTKYEIILVNGPSKSGKDTLADMFTTDTQPFGMAGKYKIVGAKDKFAYPLKWAMSEFFQKSLTWLEDNKDKPVLPGNVTPRRGAINLSEVYAKPLYGDDIFGILLAKRISYSLANMEQYNYPRIVFIISDSGFDSEAEALELLHPGRVSIVRLSRKGTDFASDSRTYIKFMPQNGMATWMTNDGTKEALLQKFKVFVERVIQTSESRGT